MKPWWKSRTVWLNVAVGVGAVIEVNLGMIKGEFAPHIYLGIMGLVTGINIALRFATTQPVK